MVNIEYFVTTRFIVAGLASMIVSFLCSTCLPMPIRTVSIRIKCTTSPIVIILSTHFNRAHSIGAFTRAKSAVSKSDLMNSCFVWLSTILTIKLYVNFWFLCIRLWLYCSKLRATLVRTKSVWSRNPVLKFFVAPFAGERCPFVRVMICPSRFKSAFLGTKSSIWVIQIKWFFANFTGLIARGVSFVLSIAGAIAKFLSLVRSGKLSVALFADFSMRHFNTSCCVSPDGVGARLRNAYCQRVASSLKPIGIIV